MLTDDQQRAADDIIARIQDGESVITFSGCAGSGKTFTLQYIINQLMGARIVTVTAPTHKAVAVLEEGLKNCAVATLHSALGLIMKRTGGQEKLAPTEKTPSFDILVIDEASMIGTELMGFIAGAKVKTVLFVGDKYQLPPIETDEKGETVTGKSIAFDVAGPELTAIVRTNSPAMATTWDGLRNHVIQNTKPNPWTLGSQLITTNDAIKLCACGSVSSMLGSGDTRIVSFTNKRVDFFNTEVRRELHGVNVPQFIPGERVVIQKPLTKPDPDNPRRRIIILSNQTEVMVKEVKQAVFRQTFRAKIDKSTFDSFGVSIKYFELTTTLGDVINVVSDESQQALRGAMARLRQWGLKHREWDGFWELHDAFIPVKHAFACTVHKSQGSTFDHVIVDLKGLPLWDQDLYNRLLYVGATRGQYDLDFIDFRY